MDYEYKESLTTDEIIQMCEKLAGRYYKYNMKDDIVSEAVLAIYERLDKNPDEYPAKLYNIAKGAMFDYVNLKCKALSIPINDTTRAVAMGNPLSNPNDWRRSTYSDEGIEAIRNALQPSVEFDDEYIAPTESGAQGYEDKEFIEKGLNLLTDRERDIIESRYYDNKTQEELAVLHGTSQSTLDRWEKVALKKMGKV